MGSYKWVFSRVVIIITPLSGLLTPLITAHEPPTFAWLLTVCPVSAALAFERLAPLSQVL